MNIMLVDDNSKIRNYIKRVLTRKLGSLENIYECADGLAAVAMYRDLKPDLVLMDIKLPAIDGLEATKQILRENPDANIIIVTQYDDPVYREIARDVGAKEYVLKDNLDDIASAILEGLN